MIPIRGLRSPVVAPARPPRQAATGHRVVKMTNGKRVAPWTAEDENTLRHLWARGLSANAIAEALGSHRSRNSVLGKARRMGLAERPSPIRRGDQ